MLRAGCKIWGSRSTLEPLATMTSISTFYWDGHVAKYMGDGVLA
jgi:hypothetical protein